MKIIKPKVKTKEKVKSKEKTDIIAVPRRKTQKKLKEQKKTCEELKRFASFPQLNPNPVLEVDSSGKIIFCNDAAIQTLQELKLNDMNLFLPADIRNILSDLEQKKESQYYREITIGEKIFGEALYLAPQFNSMRIYASDITVHKRMEEELRESERRLARSQEIAHLGSWELDLVNNHLFWSDEVYRIFGLQPQEFSATYDAFLEAVHPDDRAAVDEAYSKSLREGRDSYEIEHRVVRKSSGEVCIVYEKCEHIRDESGRIIRSIGMVQDITKRKRLEEELNKYAEHLETLVKERTEELSKAYGEFEAFFNYSITPLVFLDRDFNFIRVNEAYAIACQRVISDFPGRNHFELFPDEENKAIFRRVVETKIPYQAIAKPFSFPEHSELVTYWDWTLTPILDKHGEVDFFVFSLNDVTKKKLAEEELINERQRFYDVLEMLPAYLVLLTPDYHVAFANRFFRERFGESLGRRCFEYLFGRTEPCEICETYKVLKTGLPQRWEWTGPDDRNYDIYDFPFTDIDGSPLIMEMGIDITERKKAEDALRMNEKKYRSLIEQAADGIVILDKWLNIKDVNPAICRMSGYSVEELSGLNVKTLIPSQDLAARPLPLDLLFAGETVLEERQVFRKDGSLIDVEASVKMLEDGNIQVIARDITERKYRESHDRLITSLLELFAKKESRKGYLDAVVQLIHEWSNCRCVGIRVVNEYGYIPYESYAGFNPEFIKLENMLSLNNDMCACVRAVTGQFEQQDKSVLTPNGSFCINNSPEFADRLTQEELTRFRGNCIRTGFLSIALVPVRYRGRTIGLIHLADEREGMLPPKVMEFLETITPLIGEAVFRFNTEEELKNSREQIRELFAHLQSMREQERTQIAREIHDEFGAILTGLKVDLSSLEKKMPVERELLQERLRADLELVDSAVQIVRRISSELRPSALDHLGLTAAIEWQVKEFGNRSEIPWDISIDIKDIDLDKDLSIAVFRIFQEALINIMRHAEATKINVNLLERDGFLILELIDNGKGIPIEKLSDPHSFGLMGMRERVQYLGGDLEIKGIINKGTTVTVKIPVKGKEAV
jgi:PAS domain S-box-containing protein